MPAPFQKSGMSRREGQVGKSRRLLQAHAAGMTRKQLSRAKGVQDHGAAAPRLRPTLGRLGSLAGGLMRRNAFFCKLTLPHPLACTCRDGSCMEKRHSRPLHPVCRFLGAAEARVGWILIDPIVLSLKSLAILPASLPCVAGEQANSYARSASSSNILTLPALVRRPGILGTALQMPCLHSCAAHHSAYEHGLGRGVQSACLTNLQL